MKRTRIITPIGLVAAWLILSPGLSHAFAYSGVGGKVGMLDPEGGDTGPAMSAHLEFYQPRTRWHLQPSVMFWDSNRMTGLSANLDTYFHFLAEGVATPYAGAGVGINHFDPDGSGNGDTRLGLNLFGGLRFPTRGSQLFLEGRYTSARFSQVSLLGGVTFLGSR